MVVQHRRSTSNVTTRAPQDSPVVYNEQGSVFGGYTSASLVAGFGATRDGKAFLFQLKYSDKDTFQKCPVSNATLSIYSYTSYGPAFGGSSGCDMNLFTGTINSRGGLFQLKCLLWYQLHDV
ncbi:hypothetical protein DPMN_164723 [Dreissena polymorpha]|uniref:TLDc domain-containing protein n=1 Tax=Dreissena polymorpha TaxID=45954 RepID=A0A9D4EVJ6_DREPO|nr:hypothetical protein DPMN_164723 [Dreissena polymorpha]